VTRDIVRNPVEGGDDVRLVEVGGRTGPAAEPLDEAPLAIERWREDVIGTCARAQTVVGSYTSAILPRLTSSPELTEPSRTAVGPTTK